MKRDALLDKLCRDATYLHAMCEGVDALYDRVETDPSPASNAMPAMLESLIHRAERLLQDLEELNKAQWPTPTGGA